MAVPHHHGSAAEPRSQLAQNRRALLVAVPLAFACAAVAGLALGGEGGGGGGEASSRAAFLQVAGPRGHAQGAVGGASVGAATGGAERAGATGMLAAKPAGGVSKVIHLSALPAAKGDGIHAPAPSVASAPGGWGGAPAGQQSSPGAQVAKVLAHLTERVAAPAPAAHAAGAVGDDPAAQVAKVLADMSAVARGKGAAPEKAKAKPETDQQLQHAAEVEAEKDAVTADDEPQSQVSEVLKGEAHRGKKGTDERSIDASGMRVKKVEKAKKPKLSKGVIEAMKTGLEAGWAEDAAAKQRAAKDAAAYYADLRKRMLLLDERHELREKAELAARRNHSTSEDNADLLNALDKVYASDGPTVSAHPAVKAAAAKGGAVKGAEAKGGKGGDFKEPKMRAVIAAETKDVLKGAESDPVAFIKGLFK